MKIPLVTTILLAAALLALRAPAVVGAEPASQPATVHERLQPLAFLVGHCWVGTFPDGKSTDTHCFEPVFDGRFIRDTHVVRGAKTPYQGETIYGWDGARKALVFTYWASDGGLTQGTVEPAANGELVFPEVRASESGEMQIRTIWTPRGDTYDVVSTRKKGDAWREMFRMTMTRVAR